MAGYKILIVEDDMDIARVEKEHLEKWDFSVHCVEDFRQVASEAIKYQPDLISSDRRMPYGAH